MLDDVQIERYSRQIILPEVGGRGQERLLQSRVVLVGADRLGQLVALYLTGAGVGRLDWHPGADDPSVADTLLADLAGTNPDSACRWRTRTDPLASESPDVVIATSANPRDGDAANAAAIAAGCALVAGRAADTWGWVGVFAGHRRDQACLRCADVAWQSERASPLGRAFATTVIGVIASLQATSVLRSLLGIGDGQHGTLWLYDGATSRMQAQPVTKRPGCSRCGH